MPTDATPGGLADAIPNLIDAVNRAGYVGVVFMFLLFTWLGFREYTKWNETNKRKPIARAMDTSLNELMDRLQAGMDQHLKQDHDTHQIFLTGMREVVSEMNKVSDSLDRLAHNVERMSDKQHQLEMSTSRIEQNLRQ